MLFPVFNPSLGPQRLFHCTCFSKSFSLNIGNILRSCLQTRSDVPEVMSQDSLVTSPLVCHVHSAQWWPQFQIGTHCSWGSQHNHQFGNFRDRWLSGYFPSLASSIYHYCQHKSTYLDYVSMSAWNTYDWLLTSFLHCSMLNVPLEHWSCVTVYAMGCQHYELCNSILYWCFL